MGVGLCLNCSAEKDTRLLKKCGGCGNVLYCSVECQKISWKTTHKYSCFSVPPLPAIGTDDFDKRLNKIVDRWMHEWRGIYERYAVAALDLSNYPGRHVTHAMCMEFKYTGDKDPARSFEFMRGSVCAVEDILSRQPNLKVLRDPPTLEGERVRCVLTFHYSPGEGPIKVCKVRAQAWSDPLLYPMWYSLSMEASRLLANGIFNFARTEFATGNPNKIRAGETSSGLRDFL